jgi:hypothetical protein
MRLPIALDVPIELTDQDFAIDFELPANRRGED